MKSSLPHAILPSLSYRHLAFVSRMIYDSCVGFGSPVEPVWDPFGDRRLPGRGAWRRAPARGGGLWGGGAQAAAVPSGLAQPPSPPSRIPAPELPMSPLVFLFFFLKPSTSSRQTSEDLLRLALFSPPFEKHPQASPSGERGHLGASISMRPVPGPLPGRSCLLTGAGSPGWAPASKPLPPPSSCTTVGVVPPTHGLHVS